MKWFVFVFGFFGLSSFADVGWLVVVHVHADEDASGNNSASVHRGVTLYVSMCVVVHRCMHGHV